MKLTSSPHVASMHLEYLSSEPGSKLEDLRIVRLNGRIKDILGMLLEHHPDKQEQPSVQALASVGVL